MEEATAPTSPGFATADGVERSDVALSDDLELSDDSSVFRRYAIALLQVSS